MKRDWRSTSLGDVVEVMRNGVNCAQDKSGHGDRITRIETISDGRVNSARVGFASLSRDEKQKYRLQAGDILFSHINSNVHVGKTAIVEGDTDLYHGVNLMLIRPKAIMDPNYLSYYLKSVFYSGYWKGVCKQSVNQSSVNQVDIKAVPVQHPLLAEQQRIVAILDHAFEGLALAAANAEKNLKNAREIFDSYLNSVFVQKGQGWKEKKLVELGQLQTGTTPKTSESANLGRDIPFIKPGDFNPDGSLNYDNEGLSELGLRSSRLICAGSALMVCIGATIGKAGYTDRDIAANQQVNAITPMDGALGKYLSIR